MHSAVFQGRPAGAKKLFLTLIVTYDNFVCPWPKVWGGTTDTQPAAGNGHSPVSRIVPTADNQTPRSYYNALRGSARPPLCLISFSLSSPACAERPPDTSRLPSHTHTCK